MAKKKTATIGGGVAGGNLSSFASGTAVTDNGGAAATKTSTPVAATGKVGTGTAVANPTSTTPTTASTAAVSAPTVNLKSQYQARQAETANRINDLYAKQYQTQANKLKTEYDKNLSDAQAALGQIAPQYRQSANQMAINYERARRNMNLNAMNSGLATGVQQQQQNAYNSKWLNDYGNLRAEEANAINSANQGIADLRSAYNNALVNAQAESNNKRDQALIEAYNKDREWYENQAKILAGYGDFTAYKDLYGSANADTMRNAYIAQNPDVAFRSGMISKAEYKKITGKDPEYKSIYTT